MIEPSLIVEPQILQYVNILQLGNKEKPWITSEEKVFHLMNKI